MSSIRAIVVDPEVQGRLAIKEVEAPQAGPSEALVQVEAISLNRGEVLLALEYERILLLHSFATLKQTEHTCSG